MNPHPPLWLWKFPYNFFNPSLCMYLYIQNYFYYHFIINICVHEKGEMFIIFSGHAQASDPDPEIAAKHGQDARQ